MSTAIVDTTPIRPGVESGPARAFAAGFAASYEPRYEPGTTGSTGHDSARHPNRPYAAIRGPTSRTVRAHSTDRFATSRISTYHHSTNRL